MKNFLLTRPSHQNDALASGIRELGGNPVLLPCIEIESLNITNANKNFDIAIVTSTNAINENTLQIQANTWLSIGPTTAAMLQSHDIKSIIPEQFSSEGLLALPQLHSLSNQTIAIITGENPKPTLANVLQTRGADVHIYAAYRRLCPKYTPDKIKAIKDQNYEWIITTSRDCLINLVNLFEAHLTWLQQQRLLVISDNMMTLAKQLSINHVNKSKSAHSDDILDYLAMTQK